MDLRGSGPTTTSRNCWRRNSSNASQSEGRSYWLTLTEKFHRTFSVFLIWGNRSDGSCIKSEQISPRHGLSTRHPAAGAVPDPADLFLGADRSSSLSWFPNLDWGNPVLSSVSAITDPYLNAFRGLIPPLGGIDLSAILAFLALNLLQSLVGQSINAFYMSGSTWCHCWLMPRSNGSKSSSSTSTRVRTGALNPRARGFLTRTARGSGRN